MTDTVPTPSAKSSPFWTFSLGLYRQPGVAEACLQLQDRCGVDVNVALFLLWRALDQRRLRDDAVRALIDAVRPWQSEVIAPIRGLRRMLKSGAPLLKQGDAEVFRNKIKAIELEAERLQQEAMAALAPDLASEPATSVTEAARAMLAAYEIAIEQRFDAVAIDALLTALEAFAPPGGRVAG